METPKPTTQNKKEDKKGGVPTLSDTTQTLRNPAFKVKDLSARTLVDRFKQFRKKDLAFILAGLGVLFTAPMAERYLMSPTKGSSDVFKEGWGFRPGQGGLGAGGSPFDTGENGFATGNQIGENGDIITPANFRDPSSLILGPEAEAQPPATTSEAPASGSEGSNWKNALAEAGGNAAKKALGSAGLPMPPITLSKNMLSGLGGLSPQGGGEHYSLPPVGGGHVPNSPNVSNSLGAVKANPNLKGVGPWSETGNGSGSIEALKTAGGNAASQFSNPSAAKGLQNAAAVQMPTANPNRFGSAGADKGLGNNSVKMNKNLGESLAFMAAKMNMQKAIDLQWKLAEKKAMMWPNIEEKMLTDMITKPLAGVEDALSSGLAGFLGGPSADTYTCQSGSMSGQPFTGVQSCDPGSHIAKGASYCIDSMNSIWAVSGKDGMASQVGTNCNKANGGSSVANSTGTDASPQKAVSDIIQTCNSVTTTQPGGGTAVGQDLPNMKNVCADVKDASQQMNNANQKMGTMGTSNEANPPSSSNYDARKSPVRGFVLNPIHSLLWAFAGQIFNATARAQSASSSCSSVSGCLKNARSELFLEISDMKGALDRAKSRYQNNCVPYMQAIDVCKQGSVDEATEKSIDQAIKGMQSVCYPSIKSVIGKDSSMAKSTKNHDGSVTGDLDQSNTLLSKVKETFEGRINTDESAAEKAARQIKSKRNEAAFKGYAAQIGGIHKYVDGERKSWKTCVENLQSYQRGISVIRKGIGASYKRLRWLLSSAAQAAPPNSAPPADTAAVLVGQAKTIAQYAGGMDSHSLTNQDYQSFNRDACQFHRYVLRAFKELEGFERKLKSASGDLSKFHCPSSGATAGQTQTASQ